MQFVVTTAHVLAVLVVVFALAYVGRLLARLLRQPVVIGEIALGLAVGPLIVAAGGPGLITVLIPPTVFDCVRFVGHIGLVLFLIGVVHELRTATNPVRGKPVYLTAIWATLIPLVMGGILAWYVLADGSQLLRGDAPAVSLALMLAVSLSVTAVPVLARILADKQLTDTTLGRLSMTVAVIIDVVAWLLVAVAVGLKAGGTLGVLLTGGVLAVGLGCMVLIRRVLSTERVTALCQRFPRITVALIATTGLVASGVLQAWGLTEIFGAILVGFAIPASKPWSTALSLIERGSLQLVPVFFVITGILVFTKQFGPPPWLAMVLAVVLGVAGKVGGGYVGARHGGLDRHTALQTGVLLNTRGLTELVVLQAGFSAGILTPAVYLALVVMALVTTAMTGPLYGAISSRTERSKSPALPAASRM
jgi:Kef-type K+ transport system membrane component KefB